MVGSEATSVGGAQGRMGGASKIDIRGEKKATTRVKTRGSVVAKTTEEGKKINERTTASACQSKFAKSAIQSVETLGSIS